MLVVDRVLGNVHDSEDLALRVQAGEKAGTASWVALSFHDAQRRRLRTTARDGVEVGIDMPRGTALRDGDVLDRAGDGSRLVAVEVAPSEAMAIRLSGDVPDEDLFAVGVRLGHMLGNQHWPVGVERDTVLTPVTIDRVVMETVLRTHGFAGLTWEFVTVDPGELPAAMPRPDHRHA